MPGLLWIFFLCFFMCLLLLVSALAGVTIGTTTSAVAHMDSVKSLIPNLLMLPLLLGRIKRDRHPSAAGGRRHTAHAKAAREGLLAPSARTAISRPEPAATLGADLLQGTEPRRILRRTCHAISRPLAWSARYARACNPR